MVGSVFDSIEPSCGLIGWVVWFIQVVGTSGKIGNTVGDRGFDCDWVLTCI